MQCTNRVDLGNGQIACTHEAKAQTNPPQCSCCVMLGPHVNEVRIKVNQLIERAVAEGNTEGVIVVVGAHRRPAMHTTN